MAEQFPDWLRGLGAREPGWTYGSVLPLRSRQDEAGQTEMGFAVPEVVSEALAGWADLLEGPRTGQVTPEAALSLPASGIAASAGRVPAEALGMFIGPRGAARMPDEVRSNLDKAARLYAPFESEGIPDEEVWRRTGWTFGFPTPKDVGAQPRYELPGVTDVDFRPDFPWQALDQGAMVGSSLGAALEPTQAGQLFKLYPELEDYTLNMVRGRMPDVSGKFFGPWEDIYRNRTVPQPGRISIVGSRNALGSPTAQERNVLLHELQHAVQEQEGWQFGSSASHVESRPELNAIARDEAYDLYTKARRAAAERELDPWTLPGGVDLTDYRNALAMGIHNVYRRVPGEVEARLTQFRSQYPHTMQYYPYSQSGLGPEYEDFLRMAWPGDYPR